MRLGGGAWPFIAVIHYRMTATTGTLSTNERRTYCDMKKLSPRQRKFCEEYARTGVAERAAIDAGYSRNTARAQGTRLLENVGVKAYLRKLQGAAAELAQVKINDVMQELALIAFADLTEFVEWDADGVRLKQSTTLDELRRRAIIEVRQTGNGITIKLADKGAALERLGKALGMFVDKVEHSFNVSELLKQRREKVRAARKEKRNA